MITRVVIILAAGYIVACAAAQAHDAVRSRPARAVLAAAVILVALGVVAGAGLALAGWELS